MMMLQWEKKDKDNRILQPTSFWTFVWIFCCTFVLNDLISPVNGIREHDGRKGRKLQTVGKFMGTFKMVKAGLPATTPLSETVLGVYKNGSTVNLTPFNNVGLSLMIPFTCCFTSVTMTFKSITTVDTSAPYSLLGNMRQNFTEVPDLNIPGPKSVVVAGYSGSTLVATLSLTFVVMRSPLSPTVPAPVPVSRPAPVPVPISIPVSVPMRLTKPPLMLDTTKILVVAGDPNLNIYWADSYSVGGNCFCSTNFDHGIGDKIVMTPLGNRTVRNICRLLRVHAPPTGKLGRPVYNTVNCGNGPINDDSLLDEITCPGRVDWGVAGCGHIGPAWNFTLLLPVS